MAMSTSIVPWLGLWIIHYEGWRATGHWEGGGVDTYRHERAGAGGQIVPEQLILVRQPGLREISREDVPAALDDNQLRLDQHRIVLHGPSRRKTEANTQ